MEIGNHRTTKEEVEQRLVKRFDVDKAERVLSPYIIIKAQEDGVRVMGLTRGKETRVSHTEILSTGEIIITQLTEFTAAFKIVGKAQILSPYGEIIAEGEVPKFKEFKEKAPEF